MERYASQSKCAHSTLSYMPNTILEPGSNTAVLVPVYYFWDYIFWEIFSKAWIAIAVDFDSNI